VLDRRGFKHRNIQMSPPQILALSFFVAIVIGTFLLKLPIATTEPIRWLDALFTATSATTVTGLVVLDTGLDFTVFGQIVIMILIQIGGLGLMTFAVLIVVVLGKKIGPESVISYSKIGFQSDFTIYTSWFINKL